LTTSTHPIVVPPDGKETHSKDASTKPVSENSKGTNLTGGNSRPIPADKKQPTFIEGGLKPVPTDGIAPAVSEELNSTTKDVVKPVPTEEKSKLPFENDSTESVLEGETLVKSFDDKSPKLDSTANLHSDSGRMIEELDWKDNSSKLDSSDKNLKSESNHKNIEANWEDYIPKPNSNVQNPESESDHDDAQEDLDDLKQAFYSDSSKVKFDDILLPDILEDSDDHFTGEKDGRRPTLVFVDSDNHHGRFLSFKFLFLVAIVLVALYLTLRHSKKVS
jgi:hypothetical protein